MGNDDIAHVESVAGASETDGGKRRRERSTVEFPYSDLGNAIEIARTINDKAGLECEVTQLATWLGHSATGGTFRSRYSAARIFGLIETERGGRATLTELGRDALNAATEDEAKVRAFLNVDLFRQMYDSYKGRALPPAAAVERMVTSLGVAPKQAERARQTFIKSAGVAQFIDSQTGAFIEPAFPTKKADRASTSNAEGGKEAKGGGDGGGLPPKLDPIIRGLIDRLPEAGANWPHQERKLWLGILENTFQLVYRDKEGPHQQWGTNVTEDSA